MDFLVGPNVIMKILIRGKQEDKGRKEMPGQRPRLEDKRSGHRPRKACSLETGKGMALDSSPDLQEQSTRLLIPRTVREYIFTVLSL